MRLCKFSQSLRRVPKRQVDDKPEPKLKDRIADFQTMLFAIECPPIDDASRERRAERPIEVGELRQASVEKLLATFARLLLSHLINRI